MTDAELRELDARIHREVMGKFCEYATDQRDWVTYSQYGMGRIPHYSAEIAAAWQVVEKMQANGRGCVLCDTCGKPPWHCGFEIEDEGVADTAPLAICLAAVAFVEASAPLTPTLRDAQDSAG